MNSTQDFLRNIGNAITRFQEAISEVVTDAFDRINNFIENIRKGFCYNGSTLVTWHRYLNHKPELRQSYWYRFSFKQWRYDESFWNLDYRYYRDKKKEDRVLRKFRKYLNHLPLET